MMTGRRLQVRFGTAEPWEGDVRILREVVACRTSHDEITVVSGAPSVPGETMNLDLIGGGTRLAVGVRVTESRPAVVGTVVRHRIRLGIEGPPAPVLDAVLASIDLVAVLGRRLPVMLLDISSAGCGLESPSRLDAGGAGRLRVIFEDVEYGDDIRIVRCRAREGSSGLYYAGAEFLWTTRPHERSLRRVIARLHGRVAPRAGFERLM
jgi:hypothetical protein